MPCYLAIDYGSKRIGLAISDAAGTIASPLKTIQAAGRPEPLSRALGAALATASAKPVEYWDERLSSFAAEELLQPAQLTRKKRRGRLDQVAAQVILVDFLSARANPLGPDTPSDPPKGEHP
jgi:putative Holliday junction resolvase